MDNKHCERRAVAGFFGFLNSEIYGSDWSVSFLGRFKPQWKLPVLRDHLQSVRKEKHFPLLEVEPRLLESLSPPIDKIVDTTYTVMMSVKGWKYFLKEQRTCSIAVWNLYIRTNICRDQSPPAPSYDTAFCQTSINEYRSPVLLFYSPYQFLTVLSQLF